MTHIPLHRIAQAGSRPDSRRSDFVSAADEATPPKGGRLSLGPRRGTAKTARADQRSRLLTATAELVTEIGYPNIKVGDIAARAGVSRATFYELFENKSECFLAAHRQLAAQMTVQVREALDRSEPARAPQAGVTALVSFADREPLAFNLLTHDAMVAGAAALAERDALIASLEQPLQQAYERAPGNASMPDLPAGMLLGGVIRLLGIRMRRGEERGKRLLTSILGWLSSYDAPRSTHRWSGPSDGAELLPVERSAGTGPLPPQPLPRGRHRLPVEVVQRIQRERILHATAETIRAKGFANITVADVVASARVSRDVFYSHFHDRQEAFTETHKLVFEQIMATTASAFFGSPGDWPEQVWASGRAFTGFFAAAPSFAHFGFVESYALGPAGAQRTDDALLAFTVFLEEGYRHSGRRTRPSELASEAIAATIMETAAFYVRHDRAEELSRLLPLITYVILAPFIGIDEANEFIERKLREARADAAG